VLRAVDLDHGTHRDAKLSMAKLTEICPIQLTDADRLDWHIWKCWASKESAYSLEHKQLKTKRQVDRIHLDSNLRIIGSNHAANRPVFCSS
jgi:hypothetical protein